MMAQSYGYAVLPTIGKGGIGIGAAGGTGCVFKQGAHTGNVSMGQITIGFQLGGQAYSQIILFKNADVYHDFTRGQFEFGADATAVALTYGAQAGASTKGASASAGDTKAIGSWKRGMAVYTLAKGGLMYEASIGGQKFKFKPLKD
jgi:lipid-binding SYLF domain-containing protein